MKNPRTVSTAGPENYWSYLAPMYQVTDDGIEDLPETVIQFCRGDKSDATKPRQRGVFVESLLEICVQRLQGVNVGELASRETSVAITRIQEAIMWLEKRSSDRRVRGVEQTYKK